MRARTTLPEDLQQSPPPAPISLTKAGVTRSAKAIRILDGGSEQLFQAEIACYCDLDPSQKGVHMSRFEETVNATFRDGPKLSDGDCQKVKYEGERLTMKVAT